MKRTYKLFSMMCLLSALFLTQPTKGDITLPYLLSSNMVLQRDGATAIWGWATAGEKITVEFRDASYKAKAGKDGKWKVMIQTGDAGGPFNLVITGDNTITLRNVLVGDVWVCSGQSNMEWPLISALGAEKEIGEANHPALRLFQVENNAQVLPAENTPPAEWKLCIPKTVAGFSAIAYYFGKKLNRETGIPIGLISSNWGGTIVETWTSGEAMADDTEIQEWLSGLKNYDAETEAKRQEEISLEYQSVLAEMQQPDWEHEYIQARYKDTDWEVMPVASLWETLPGWENFDGIVWFRKKITLPPGFQTGKAVLSLAKIDDTDVVWINGKRIGETYNLYNLNRSYQVPENVLNPGENTIVIRVEDYTGGGGFHGEKSDLNLTDGVFTIDLSEDWKIKKDPLAVPRNPNNPNASGLMPNQFPTLLFNGMINPLLNYAIKGAIWYQGESNADFLAQAKKYDRQIKRMITDWRKHWNVGDFSFYQVQLANFRDETAIPKAEVWPFLREAQTSAISLPKVEMACIIDIGDAGDIHPRNKKDVGNRLALKALKLDYGKEMVANGPRLKSYSLNGIRASIVFETEGTKLEVRNKYGYINGFSVAGPDQVFHFAQASLKPDGSVEVWCDNVDNILSVRFLWSDNPGEINLYNSAGLPAEPFRTDTW